ncbi:MAG: mechanosensitive ion channel, partial [Halioglobus sp.]|nr:mechanosensitive ion channel [Halioglobus sp.]
MSMITQLAQYHPALPDITVVFILLLTAFFAYVVAHRLLDIGLRAVAKYSTYTWSDALIKNGVGKRLAQLFPAFTIHMGVNFLPSIDAGLETFVMNLTSAYMMVVATITIIAVLNAANDIYESNPEARQRPIKGFIQLLQLAVVILGGLLFIAALLDQSPVLLLSGFGAMTAVLLLVFKDTLLSLVASVQLAAQDMVRVGDWIEVPQLGADGDVVDMELYTVTVQNFDKTITTIPTQRLITDSFKNWRGMSSSGGRRIKRALHIDASSIRFISEQDVNGYRRFSLLEDYLAGKHDELKKYNQTMVGATADESDAAVNMRRLTNIGTFRAYAWRYLKEHPRIRKDMTLLVRQLAPDDGIPIELYCFTNTVKWTEYEDIQADIFDHLLAIMPEFGLQLFQRPAGKEFSIRQLP